MQTLNPMKIIVVPAWIQRAALRNKLNTIELLDYKKVRAILSLDDMAEWFHVNDSLKIDDINLSNTGLQSLWSNLSPDAQQEISNSVLPLSGSEEIASSANHKLTITSDNIGNLLSDQLFQFIRIEHILYIVLSEGFVASLSDASVKADFVKKYLKECYAMTSVADVSKLGIFDLYMKQFAI
jgi:hypothetical protein